MRKVSRDFSRHAIIDMSGLLELVPVARSTIYNWVRKGEFPKPRRFGRRRSGWLQSEINAWIEERMAA